jgi:glycosyl transferase family 2
MVAPRWGPVWVLVRVERTGSGSGVRISFCVTCKNRLWQLRHTFPANVDAVAADGAAELVLLNYNSADGLDRWVRRFEADVERGLVRYVHERSAPHFHCSKAKNLAHLAATGDFVVNLDADNLVGDTIAAWRRAWDERPDTVLHGFSGDYGDGTYGRIGVPRTTFLAIGGYDEAMLPLSQQDKDLIMRAEASGLRYRKIPQPGVAALRNSVGQKMRYSGLPMSYAQMSHANVRRLQENRRRGRVTVNASRQPSKVLLNFTTEIEL